MEGRNWVCCAAASGHGCWAWGWMCGGAGEERKGLPGGGLCHGPTQTSPVERVTGDGHLGSNLCLTHDF